MNARNFSFQPLYPFGVFCGLLVAFAGCRKGEEGSNIVPLEGKVEKINARSDGTGDITVVYTDKQQQSITGTGEVTSETEIIINGAAAKLKDIREGEHVRGQVRIEKKGKQRKQIAVSIYVDRAQPVNPDK